MASEKQYYEAKVLLKAYNDAFKTLEYNQYYEVKSLHKKHNCRNPIRM